MIKILRPDHRLEIKDNQISLVNINFNNVSYPIDWLTAFVLSLHDGYNSEKNISEIINELFPNKIKMTKRILTDSRRFLMNVEMAKTHWNIPFPIYDSKMFLHPDYIKPITLKQVRSPAPVVVSLHLTNNCIRQCLYCSSESKSARKIEADALPFEKLIDVLHQSFLMAVDGILLTGGEPLLREDVYDLIEYALNSNMFVRLITKAPLDRDRLKKIHSRRLYLTLSIDSHMPNIANALAVSDTFYNDFKTNVEMLNEIDIPFDITYVLTKMNYHHATESIKHLINLGANTIATTHYAVGADHKADKRIYLTDDEKEALDSKLRQFIDDNKLESKVSHAPLNPSVSVENSLEAHQCGAGYIRIVINGKGEYVFCEKLHDSAQFDLGNIYDKEIISLWYSDDLLKLIYPNQSQYKNTICGKCNDFVQCRAKNSCYYASLEQYGTLYRAVKEVENVCFKK